MNEGYYYLIYLYLDEETNRLVGSIDFKYLNNAKHKLKKGDQVDIIIWSKTDLGTKVIVNGKHHGLIYSNEVFEEIKMGIAQKDS